jgi:hypothetical protein
VTGACYVIGARAKSHVIIEQSLFEVAECAFIDLGMYGKPNNDSCNRYIKQGDDNKSSLPLKVHSRVPSQILKSCGICGTSGMHIMSKSF